MTCLPLLLPFCLVLPVPVHVRLEEMGFESQLQVVYLVQVGDSPPIEASQAAPLVGPQLPIDYIRWFVSCSLS